MDCVFCNIINGKLESKKLYEDDTILAFLDIAPQAPIHFLVIPKQHISSANEINNTNSNIIARVFEIIPEIASTLNLKQGYRILTNHGHDAMQTIHHMHFHVFGGCYLGCNLHLNN